MKNNIALIGYGALAKTFLNLFETHLKDFYNLKGIYVNKDNRREEIKKDGFKTYGNFSELLEDELDYVVEFASAEAVKEYGYEILQSGISLIIISVGALSDDKFFENLKMSAENNKSEIYIASGAIGGFDLMRTFSLDSNMTSVIRTIKSPESLVGAPYLEGKVLSLEKAETIFEGNAKDAIKGFPKNVNVAVATSIATTGLENTKATIVSDPKALNNTHTIFLENKIASATIEINSKKDPKNPKSSIITAWSVVSLLKNLCSKVKFF